MVEIKSCIQWENHVYIGICGYNFLVSAQKTKKGILHKNIENTCFLDGGGGRGDLTHFREEGFDRSIVSLLTILSLELMNFRKLYRIFINPKE